jgi:phosphoribosylformylglycinamidine synthase
MVGLIDDTRKMITQGFKNEEDLIALLGVTNDDLSVSEYAQTIAGHSTDAVIDGGCIAKIDLELERKIQDAVLKLADEILINSAHDCSDGGLAVTIAECCFSSLNREAIGADIELTSNGLSNETVLFAESPSRIVISFAPENLDRVKEIARDIPIAVIGTVGNDVLKVSIDGDQAIGSPVSELEGAWESSLERALAA